MTIKELKNILNQYDENTTVVVNDEEWGWGDVNVYLSEEKHKDIVVLESMG